MYCLIKLLVKAEVDTGLVSESITEPLGVLGLSKISFLVGVLGTSAVGSGCFNIPIIVEIFSFL